MAKRRPSSKLLVRARDRARLTPESFSHPLNPRSLIRGFSLSSRVGLKRAGCSLIQIPPGKESFVYHTHLVEEEWMFVLSGRGIAEIGDDEYEIGPGDFLGFPAPSVGHHLRNPFAEELVYLSGGERGEVEIAEFPRLGKRLVRAPGQVTIHPIAAEKPLWPRRAKARRRR